jgi:hypothetical protein
MVRKPSYSTPASLVRRLRMIHPAPLQEPVQNLDHFIL